MYSSKQNNNSGYSDNFDNARFESASSNSRNEINEIENMFNEVMEEINSKGVQEVDENNIIIEEYNKGIRYFNGDGVNRDYNEAIYNFRFPAAEGFAPAQYMLGYTLYHHGEGGLEKYIEAEKWLKEAAEQGHTEAKFMLGFLYYTRFGGLDKGIDTNEKYKIAVEWLKKASDQGHNKAKLVLGSMYEKGLGVLINHQRASELYLEAASEYESLALYNLGKLYIENSKKQEGIKYLKKVANNNGLWSHFAKDYLEKHASELNK